MLWVYAIFLEDETELGNGEYIDISQYRLIEPILDEADGEFPTLDTDDNFDEIPRIIHQTWREDHVPEKFRANIESFVDKNPSFEYHFWTDASGRELIEERHPHLLETFDNYVEPVRRADLLRYTSCECI